MRLRCCFSILLATEIQIKRLIGRQLHILSAKCLRVESNFDEESKFCRAIKIQFQDL